MRIVIRIGESGQVHLVLAVTAHDQNLPDTHGPVGIDDMTQHRPTRDFDHRLGHVLGQRGQCATSRCGQHQCTRCRSLFRKIAVFRLFELADSLQPENLADRDNVIFQGQQLLRLVQVSGGFLHRLNRRTQHVVGPDHDRTAGVAKYVCRCRVVLGRNDKHRAAITPARHELKYLVRYGQRTMNQDAVRPCFVISISPFYRLIHAPACNQRLDTGDDTEIVVRLGILARLDLAAEFVDVSQLLPGALDKAVRFWKELVFYANGGYFPLLQLSHQPPHIVEIAVTGVAIEHDRDGCGLGHEFDCLQDLGPARLIAVANTKLRGDGQAACPQTPETGFLTDTGADAIVSFEQKLSIAGVQQSSELLASAQLCFGPGVHINSFRYGSDPESVILVR